MGKPGQSVPAMSDEWLDVISKRYIELYEKVIGEPFSPSLPDPKTTYESILKSLKRLKS
jgi:phosphoribosylaminoimidazole-succinocarboxamide synthase